MEKTQINELTEKAKKVIELYKLEFPDVKKDK